jgi:hypothetical protein
MDSSGRLHTARGHKAWALLAGVLVTRTRLDGQTLASELVGDAEDPLGFSSRVYRIERPKRTQGGRADHLCSLSAPARRVPRCPASGQP